MNGKEIRDNLRKGDRVYGTHIASLGNPVDLSIRTKINMDFVFICTEHMPIDRTEVSMMCQIYSANGICPIVRIPYPSPKWASMFIDGGAKGIVAPYVETKDEIRELIGAIRYSPIKGKFLSDILDGKRQMEPKMENYINERNQNQFLIIGIESMEAINNLGELLSYNDVDGVFLGPHDISCSMEIPEEYENPEFIKTIKYIIKTCRKMGKGVGFHNDMRRPAFTQFLDDGLNFVIDASDIVKVTKTLNADFKFYRENMGDTYNKSNYLVNDLKTCVISDG